MFNKDESLVKMYEQFIMENTENGAEILAGSQAEQERLNILYGKATKKEKKSFAEKLMETLKGSL